MGRLHHLEQTLLKNIEDNLSDKGSDPSVEFVLVDYNSQDGLRDWVRNNPALQKYLENGTLVYARHPDATHFHHAHAKNMAHRLATGDVVCNLDADNFTGKGFARFLAGEFADDRPVLVYPATVTRKALPEGKDGCFGRIAMRREDFHALGGYSEAYKKGWGFEDLDLIVRALANKFKPRPIFNPEFLDVIAHDHEERIKNAPGGLTVKHIEDVFSGRAVVKWARFYFNVSVSPVQANREGNYGAGKVVGLDGEEKTVAPLKKVPHIAKRNLKGVFAYIKGRRIVEPGRNIQAVMGKL